MNGDLSPEFWIELFSTIFFAATIGIMIWEANRQKKDFKAQIEGLRKESYEIIRNDHAELGKMLIENKTLRKIWKFESDPNIKISNDEEKQIFEYYILQLDLYERLFLLMIKEDSNVKYHEWQMWLSWLQSITHHKIFKKTFDEFKHVYDPEFVNEIEENLFNKPTCKNCETSFENMKEIVEHINAQVNELCYKSQERKFGERAKRILKEREVE